MYVCMYVCMFVCMYGYRLTRQSLWQAQQNGVATVCNDEGAGLFTAGLPVQK